MKRRGPTKSEAILKAMTPLTGGGADDPKVAQRRLLADLCRLIGAHIDGAQGRLPVTVSASFPKSSPKAADNAELSPRMRETLNCLLAGDSEKQADAQARRQPAHRARLRQAALSQVQREQPRRVAGAVGQKLKRG